MSPRRLAETSLIEDHHPINLLSRCMFFNNNGAHNVFIVVAAHFYKIANFVHKPILSKRDSFVKLDIAIIVKAGVVHRLILEKLTHFLALLLGILRISGIVKVNVIGRLHFFGKHSIAPLFREYKTGGLGSQVERIS